MSGFYGGTSVQVKGRDGTDAAGTVVSWDDTRHQYLVRIEGDPGQRYFRSDEVTALS